jgi:FKBP-type peptidyl-prolyl cis-trans isomerase 2
MSTAVVNIKMKVKGGPVVIDTTAAGSEPLKFVVGDHAVIRGIEEAVLSMAAGEVAKVEVAPKYGFAGSKGVDAGPVVGVIELVSFENDAESWDLSAEQKVAQATSRKGEGNVLFKAGE